MDFLNNHEQVDWVITNPPYSLADSFIDHALKVTKVGAAFLCRINILEGESRYAKIYSRHKPTCLGLFFNRMPMSKGMINPFLSSTVLYCWVVFGPVENEGIVWLKDELYLTPSWRSDKAVGFDIVARDVTEKLTSLSGTISVRVFIPKSLLGSYDLDKGCYVVSRRLFLRFLKKKLDKEPLPDNYEVDF